MRDKRGQKKMALKNASSKAVACVEGSRRELPAQEQKAKKKTRTHVAWIGFPSLFLYCFFFTFFNFPFSLYFPFLFL
jgi:hypothetical protein